MKATILTDTQIGDLLDLNSEYTYPCSDGSQTITLDCHELLGKQADEAYGSGKKAGIKEVVEFIKWLDNGTRSCGSWRSEMRKFREAKLKELGVGEVSNGKRNRERVARTK